MTAERYRLAWLSARRRARNATAMEALAYSNVEGTLMAVIEERAALRAQLAESERRYAEVVAELRERVP